MFDEQCQYNVINFSNLHKRVIFVVTDFPKLVTFINTSKRSIFCKSDGPKKTAAGLTYNYANYAHTTLSSFALD